MLKPMTTHDEPTRLYERRLASGGYVAIEALPVRPLFSGRDKIRGQVVVERRLPSRRVGHRPPVAACAEHVSIEEVVEVLVPIARSDTAIDEALARKVMRSIAISRKWELS